MEIRAPARQNRQRAAKAQPAGTRKNGSCRMPWASTLDPMIANAPKQSMAAIAKKADSTPEVLVKEFFFPIKNCICMFNLPAVQSDLCTAQTFIDALGRFDY